ncbi:MAG: cupin domain-containing protein [SAR324 cluster bacterium]|mgnify:FL=1|jgi:ethanolamine utilization protein EutQ (cupin superfamily)|uniref:(S)-ureidoglycine aminohydrolase cupin domain-containing protein n=1 Tax=marine metagenome TaxID=408172 RepID=A0A381QMY5_9ZZZZ|nr:cupin domain-containing protein [SAR324 cluster bacterium]MDP6487331.1 cupin domain-containing protein [SAR324 cluster bacterium]MDP7583326.1 cupin domain-containing protein [SAR324 cluster bacterium]|tara:strand:- start:222 stop:572 length:351 start_codon:yes stop_codon:yes gene_type:complete
MAFNYFEQIKTQELPSMEVANVPAFLKDFAVSEDSEKPITSGLFRLEAGESLQYTYTYHEMKLIIDGSFIIEDETGKKVTAKTGDLLYFPKGTAITFSTPDFGIGFFCGQRGEDEA